MVASDSSGIPLHSQSARLVKVHKQRQRWRQTVASCAAHGLRGAILAITTMTSAANETSVSSTNPAFPEMISTGTIETGLTAVQPIAWSADSRYFAVLGSKGTGSKKASIVM